jgi:hypothetical protein
VDGDWKLREGARDGGRNEDARSWLVAAVCWATGCGEPVRQQIDHSSGIHWHPIVNGPQAASCQLWPPPESLGFCALLSQVSGTCGLLVAGYATLGFVLLVR